MVENRDSGSVGGKLTLRELLGVAAGAAPYQLGFDALKHLANPVFNIVLGVNPVLLGVLHMVARAFGACLEPIVGVWSDNCRSRFGRRKPFIMVGAISGAFVLPLIWQVPVAVGPIGGATWFFVTALAFYACYAVYGVPYFSLGLEMSPDYHQRTRVTATRALATIGTLALIKWTLSISQWEGFGDPLAGVRLVGWLMGALFLIGGLAPVLMIRERYQELAQRQERIRLVTGVRESLANPSYAILCIVSALIVVAWITFDALGIYVSTYHVFGGDLKRAAYLQGLAALVGVGGTLAGVPLVIWLAHRIEKRNAALLCLGCASGSAAARWWLYTPESPYLQLLAPVLAVPSGAVWVLLNSMKADVCDEEELRTGQRREGVVGAVSGWIHKLAGALSFGLTGLVLAGTGFAQELGAAQPVETLLGLRLAFAFAPVILFLVGFVVLLRYRLDRKRVEEIRSELEQRRAAV